MRWSRLKKLVEELFEPSLNLQIFCTVHRSDGGPDIGRYWLVINKETIWEEPKRVTPSLVRNEANPVATEITAVLREYLNTPKEQLLSKNFAADRWGLTKVLLAADRRIGKRKLTKLKASVQEEAARNLIELRLRSSVQ